MLGLCLLASAPPALGQDGGGGAIYVEKPVVKKVVCVRGCASKKRAQGGSTLRIAGTGLASAHQLTFLGSYGDSDDVTVKVRPRTDTRLAARVPIGAVTGPISVVTAEGGESKPTAPLAILPPPPPTPNTELSPVPGPREAGTPLIETGTSRTKAFIGARRAVTFSFRLSGAETSSLSVQLVRASDATAVKTWAPDPAAAGEVQSVSWDGRLGSAGAQPGRYLFRLTAAAPSGARVHSAKASDMDRDAFDLYDNIFPIRGRHDYGGPGSVFGTGRAGHSHQGQDVFAKCGVPLVAARGGKVKFKQYHAAAGHYLVIDGAGTDVDYAYMHLAEPTPFQPGDRVYTGQRIGSVGETGNARGCHLHFELWDSPGWYDGGDPFDPLPSLKAWDSWS